MRHRLIIVAIALASMLAAQETLIRVPVRLVTVRSLVFSRNNRLLTDLASTDFQVLDNGRPQKFTLETTSAPLSIVLLVQVNQDVRAHVPFIARAGSAVDTLLVGEGGESAVIAYGSEVTVVKEFGAGDVQAALRPIAPAGAPARMLDAASRGIALLAKRDASRSRVLLVIGQPVDIGSEADLASVQREAEKLDVSVYAVVLPLAGKAFVSDTFSLNGVSQAERGGFRAGVDLGNLIAVLDRSAAAGSGADPFSILTAATGGNRLHGRTQRQLEDAIAAIGMQLRSAHVISYYPNPAESGYHTLHIAVGIPGAKVYSRPGYWLSDASSR